MIRGVSIQGGLCPGGLCPGEISAWGESVQGGLCRGDPPPVWYKERAVHILLECALFLE